MPAPDFETIYAIEDALDLAFATLIRAADLAAWTQREVSQVVTPYSAVQVSLGASTEHYALVGSNYRPDIWNASLQIQVVTDRKNNNPLHSTYRAKIRNVLADDAAIKASALLPYHEVFSTLETGTTPTIQAENDLDISTLTYAVKVGTRSGAWPA